MSENKEPESAAPGASEASEMAAASSAATGAGSTVPSAAATTSDSTVVGAASDVPSAVPSEAAAASSAAPSEAGTSTATSEAPDSSATTTGSTAPSSPGAKSVSSQAGAAGAPASSKSTTGKSVTGASSSKSPGAGSTTDARSATNVSRHSSRKPTGSAGQKKHARLGQLKLEDAKIGIIGAGKMADALCQGLIHYAKIPASKIHVASPSAKNLDSFKNYGCHVTKRNYDIFGRFDCNIIFLAFHGHVIKNCYKLGGARPHPLTTNYIPHQRHPIYILSMVSGVSLSQIKACLLNPESTNRYSLEIHRIMMNTAVGQGLGICAVDCEPDSRKLSAPLRTLLSSIAHLEHVPATQMDAACAIGGSGLAFSYYFINALADGAFKMGLSRKQAIRFASKTAQCAAQTLLESGKHPAELRDTVSAPSGAAIYGIHVLEKNDVASGVTAAVEAAHKRASELASEIRNN